jgi:hypothetical protein
VSHDHGYVPFVVIAIRFFPHSWLDHWVCDKSNKTVVTCEAETAYPSLPILVVFMLLDL